MKRNNQLDDFEEENLAKNLEREHERLLHASVDPNRNEVEVGDELKPALSMLELIDRVRRHRSGDSTDEGIPSGKESTVDSSFSDLEDSYPDPELASVLNADVNMISRFKLKERLGQGGFGLVFRAHDPDLDREVAIKIPRPEAMFTRDMRSRFLREAKAAAALSHPNIVTLFETGVHDSICFLVSQYIEGATLAQWLTDRDRPLDPDDAAALVASLADAIQHAHSRGVMHRDIKPSNIMVKDSTGGLLAPDQLAEAALITDFGLAKFESQIDSQTRSGAMVGTPAYMSPEQTEYSSDRVGPKSDVYSLGIVLYELLVGKTPFSGSTIVETVTAVKNQEPKSLRAHNAEIPHDLEAVCLKCLEKNPDLRYSSARELENDLRRFCDGIPVYARPVTTMDRMFRWANRNRGLTASLLALASVILVALFGLSLLLLKNDFLQKHSALQTQLADDRKQLAEKRFGELESAIDSVYSSIKRMPEIENDNFAVFREEMLSNVNRYYTSLVSEAPDNAQLKRKKVDSMLKLIKLKGSLSDNAGAVDLAEQLISAADTRDSQTIVPEIDQRIDAMVLASQSFFSNRENDRGQEYFERALSLARNQYNATSDPQVDDRIELAQTIAEIANIACAKGLKTLSNELAIEAIGVWEQIETESIDNDEAALAMARTFLFASKSHASSEKVNRAKVFNQFAIQILEDALALETQELPDVQFDLSEAYRISAFLSIDFPDQCNRHLDKAITTITQLVVEHPSVIKYHVQVLSINYYRGLVEFIAARSAVEGQSFHRRAHVEFQKNVDLAERLVRQFPEGQERILASAKNSITMLGVTAGQLGDHQMQLDALNRSHALNESLYNQSGNQEHRVLTIGTLGNIANYHLVQKNYQESIRRYESTSSELTEILESDPQAGQAERFLSGDLEYLAKAYAATGRHSDALTTYQRSMMHMKYRPVDTMKGKEAVYLVRDDRLDEATIAFRTFIRHQNQSEELSKLAGIGSELFAALDDSNTDTDTVVQWKDFVLETTLNALQSIKETNQAQFDQLIQNEQLEPITNSADFKRRF